MTTADAAMATDLLFTGVAPALITPFTPDDALDETALRSLIDWQIDQGVDGIVVLGTTGENPTVTDAERRRIVDVSVEQAAGRVPVIVGTGTNATQASIRYSKQAAAAGADGLLVVGPYYNKPTQAGFRAHVAAIAEATDCPLIIYNVPGRTRFNVTAETVLRLAEEVPTVVGVKEASGDLAQISDILAHRPDRLGVYAGDDEIALPLITLGGDGVVSVISNAVPGPFSRMIHAALDGDLAAARRQHFALLPAMRACFAETNPIPIKAVLAEMGRSAPKLRLPLIPLTDAHRPDVMEAFAPFLNG
jgi:4-hydroxy-tetrahydrodipicolinate synthase